MPCAKLTKSWIERDKKRKIWGDMWVVAPDLMNPITRNGRRRSRSRYLICHVCRMRRPEILVFLKTKLDILDMLIGLSDRSFGRNKIFISILKLVDFQLSLANCNLLTILKHQGLNLLSWSGWNVASINNFKTQKLNQQHAYQATYKCFRIK